MATILLIVIYFAFQSTGPMMKVSPLPCSLYTTWLLIKKVSAKVWQATRAFICSDEGANIVILLLAHPVAQLSAHNR